MGIVRGILIVVGLVAFISINGCNLRGEEAESEHAPETQNEWRCSKLTADFSVSEVDAEGDNWDSGFGDAKPDPCGNLVVRRSGTTIKDNSGKEANEKLSIRHNTTDFPAPFFEKSGITLQKGDTIKISLSDFDDDHPIVSKFTTIPDDFIGSVELTVDGRTTSGSPKNGLFHVTVTCE